MKGQSSFKTTLVCLVAICFVKDVDLEVPRPRGVPVEKSSLYASGVDFSCFDGSGVVPFEQVNDDYCDCPDGSDEPGTSACSTGTFHCINAGHTPLDIPSSRVNDGICDCCDGSDEYLSAVGCQDTCMELGREAREEAERKAKLASEGHQIFLEYSKQGQQAKQENQARLDNLRTEKETVEVKRNELEAIKNDAEAPEREAKDRHQKAYEEEKAKRDADKVEAELQAAFLDLDVDKDNSLTIAEMQQRDEFDIDANGEVSEEEAREHLEDNGSVDIDVFREKVWPNIKALYQAPADTPSEEEKETLEQELLEEAEDEHCDSLGHGEGCGDEELDDDNMEDLDDDDFSDDDHEKGDDGSDDMPPYDAETQALIDVAEKARTEFREMDNKLEDLKREERDLQSMLSMDLGDRMQFYPLKGACYELRDREYIYKFCPFERATQRQAFGGGPETSLGVWGRWDGSAEQPYSVMLYEKGQGCWNGPDRSVKVLIDCGVKNELVSASEPNRCEYQLEFHTPAACSQEKLAPAPAKPHEEL